MTLASFTDWLSNTTPSNVIRDVTWIIPVVQSIHIILIAIVISSTTMFNVRLLQLGPNAESLARMAHRVFPWVWWSLLGLLLSGSLLITGEPVRELLSPAFAFKIVVIFLVAPLTLLFQATLRRDDRFWSASLGRRYAARGLAMLSLLMWLSVLTAGRWIAYYQAST